MAVRFDASGDSLTRTTGLSSADPPSQNLTLCCWVKRKVDTGAFATAVYRNFGSGAIEVFIETETGGDRMDAYELPATESQLVGRTLTLDTWFFFLYTRSNTARNLYYGSEAGGTLTKVTNTDTRNVGTGTAATNRIYVGNDPFNEFTNGEIAYVRTWEAFFSDAEADAEWRSTTPVRTANLRGDWRLAAATGAGTDSSGNSLTLTINGTLANGGSDPVPPASSPAATVVWSRHRRRGV